jgi:hypothetical protein
MSENVLITPPPHELAQPEYLNGALLAARKFLRLDKPFGAITGLPPWAGAPLSAGVAGLTAGALYAGGRNLLRDPNEKPKSWKAPLAVGGTVGLGLGILSAYLQEKNKKSGDKSANFGDLQAIDQALRRDHTLSYGARKDLLSAIQQAPAQQRARIIELALVGSLTAAVAARILGFGWIGSSLAGLAGGHIYHQYTRRPKFI